MDATPLEAGVQKTLDALYAGRLAVLCGAGLSMAPPSSLPSAATLAQKAKRKYDTTYGTDRLPLPASICDQAQFFFDRHELDTVYLRTYIDRDDFAGPPNAGHLAAADLLLIGAIATAVSTNVDTLIEAAGNLLFGQIGVGVSRAAVAALPADRSPLLKIHGCWTNPPETVWAPGQIDAEPIRTRIRESAEWLSTRLLDRDLIVVGYWSDWDYLNQVLDRTFGAVTPTRVIVVDPCEATTFETKAPELYALGERATAEFCHVRCSGEFFLDRVRVDFSRAFVRRVLSFGRDAYAHHAGHEPDAAWFEPDATDPTTLWQVRRDLEGCNPNEPSKRREPANEPLLGMTILQLRARGAAQDGNYWLLSGARIRVLSTPNRPLHEVEEAFKRETAPAIAAEITIAVGAEALGVPPSIARGSASGTIARGPSGHWLSRADAVTELAL